MPTTNADFITVNVAAGGVIDSTLYTYSPFAPTTGYLGILANDAHSIGLNGGNPPALTFNFSALSLPDSVALFPALAQTFLGYQFVSGGRFGPPSWIPIYGNYTVSLGLSGQSIALAALAAGEVLHGSFSYSITQSDGTSNVSPVDITFVGINDAPVLAAPIADQFAAPGSSLVLTLPTAWFADIDHGDALTLSASNLPDWLSFNALDGIIYGTPSAEGSADIVVTATDAHGLSVSDTVRVNVAGAAAGIALDGAAGDWSAADRLDTALTGVAGFAAYGRAGADSFVIAIKAPMPIGLNTTVWLNTDSNDQTGYLIWGWAGGEEMYVNFDVDGRPSLYANGTLIAALAYAQSGDKSFVEFAIPKELVGGAETIRTLFDINDVAFLPHDYHLTQFRIGPEPAPEPSFGGHTLDGFFHDWAQSERLDDPTNGIPGFAAFGDATNDTFVVAIHAPIAIGQNTTIWLNTDNDASTGYQIWGFAGGAEAYVNFDAQGRPGLYENGVLVADLAYAQSADKTFVELAIPKALLGGPSQIHALFDINDAAFLPHDYHLTQYAIGDLFG